VTKQEHVFQKDIENEGKEIVEMLLED